ncbi:MAG: mechanosensitive ion channel family protein [Defluviicoccus sp.]|nr:MAG: mechanosensitive ion channel family protein [Defluviicoccus sp.]
MAMAAVIDALALAVFAVVGGLVFLVVQPDQEFVRTAFWAVFLAILGVRAMVIMAALILAPGRPALRLPRLDDASARRLYLWLLALTALTCGCAVLSVLSSTIGLPEPLDAALGFALQWGLTVVLLVFVCSQRRTIGRLLATGPASQRRSQPAHHLVRNGHVLLCTAIVGLALVSWLSRLLSGHSHVRENLATLALLMALPAVDGLLRMLVRWLVPPPEPIAGTTTERSDDATMAFVLRSADAAAPSQKTAGDADDFAPVIVRNMRIALAVLTVMLLDWIWGFDLHAIAAGSLGARIAGALFDIVVTLIVASAVWGVVSTAIVRHAPRDGLDAQAEIEGEAGGAGLTRLQTLLPLLRKFLLVVLIILVGMIIISSLGINIGPLLAGAGVVGIAIGFGAQTLVRDIFSGIFFLIDDAFRIGEYIDVGIAKGTVERISIRSIRLRHHLGQIHTIPFGAIRNVTNFSRDWVIMKLELRMPADTDLENVRKLVKRLGQEMLVDPEHGPHFLQPLKSQGVHRMDDDAFIVRVKFMAVPGEQFVLRREIYRRIQELFREHGIRFAPRRVIVDAEGAGGETGTAAIAAAGVTVTHPQPLLQQGGRRRAPARADPRANCSSRSLAASTARVIKSSPRIASDHG